MAQDAQTAFALATSESPALAAETGKKRSGSADRHAACSHQLLVAIIVAFAIPSCPDAANCPQRAGLRLSAPGKLSAARTRW
jgi:hypothetical protein